MPLAVWILLFCCLKCLVFTALVQGTQTDILESCDPDLLARSSQQRSARYQNPQIMARLMYVFEAKYFKIPCSRTTPATSLWDSYRPRVPISVFMHVGVFPRSTDVVKEIMNAIEYSGLSQAANIYVGLAGRMALVQLPPNVTVVAKDILPLGEYPTLNAMFRYVRQSTNPREAVLYLHTKGTFHLSPCETAWRQYMLYFTVWLFRFNLILLQFFDTSGAQLVHLPRHYSGNFWWSTSGYLSYLNATFQRDHRYHSEFFWKNTNDTHMECLFGNKVSLVDRLYEPWKYTNWPAYARLAQYVQRGGGSTTSDPPTRQQKQKQKQKRAPEECVVYDSASDTNYTHCYTRQASTRGLR